MEINMLKFELTLEEANMVLAALGKAPFEAVAGLINKLQQQAQPQMAALEAAAKATADAANPNVVTDV
jgi:hypothetical protein